VRNNQGGEQAYQSELEEAIEDEENRYQKFLKALLSKVVDKE
jgi:hypothetical protein